MRVLSVTSEIFPLVKTGGLADVAGSLPRALESHGVFTRSLIPGYPKVLQALPQIEEEAALVIFGEPARILSARIAGLDLLILDVPAFFDREGGPYMSATGHDHVDNCVRFAALSFAGAEIASGLLEDWRPDIVHVHDWHAALTLVYLRHRKQTSLPTVLTLHNLAFQGQFSRDWLKRLELPQDLFSIDCLEYYGGISLLKGGIQAADVITTVSPTYAREIMNEDLGMGMAGLFRNKRRQLRGIVNGIDMEVWDPASDPHILTNFQQTTLSRRGLNRRDLLNTFGLTDNGGPIFSVVSRLTWQKGIDLLPEIIWTVLEAKGRLIVHGQGDLDLEKMLRELSVQFPEQVAVKIGFDEKVAHVIHAGTDFVIQPSRFEPCGLTQLYALRYGAIPIVSRTGGLAETIIDANDAAMEAEVATGFQFYPVTAEELRHAIDRAVVAFNDKPALHRLQIQAMRANFSWEKSAWQYKSVYEEFSGLQVPNTPAETEKAEGILAQIGDRFSQPENRSLLRFRRSGKTRSLFIPS